MHSKKPSALASVAALVATLFVGSSANAQATPLPESIPIGGFTFRPSLELRLRGEYRQAPFDAGGVLFSSSAVFADAYGSNLPAPALVTFQPGPLQNAYAASERARLGLAVDRGPITAALVLQDARLLAADPGFAALAEGRASGGLGVYEAYIDVHGKNRGVWSRFGRQRVVWGDGRLLGASDFTLTPRALTAFRFGLSFKNIDLELLAAMLSTPLVGGLAGIGGAAGAAGSTTTPDPTPARTGSQLYGLRALWHAFPLLQVELTGLGRVARPPVTSDLTPSDTVVIDARIFGERRGFRYSVEGAYELGRISSYGGNRSLNAFALAARATWETALPWHLTFGAEGMYASGDNGTTDPLATQTRFDPILPEERPEHNRMGLFGWSNILAFGGDISARPTDALSLSLGYRYVSLADPKGRWSSASLVPIGASPTNESRTLGHQIDASIGLRLWDPLTIEAGYGLFLTGDGAKNILEASGRGRPDAQHFGYIQATVRAP